MQVQFGPFAIDAAAGRLLKQGVPLPLRDQPYEILRILVSSPGEVISRETLRAQLWGGSTFVDFENGLNSAISRLRMALGDNSRKPKWIETVPKRGYRFIGSIATSAAILYLKGHYVISPHSPESMRKSLAYFEEAIQADPAYALAYHGAALVYILRCTLDDLRPKEALAKAEEYLARGLQCPQRPAMVYNTLAFLRTFQRRWQAADEASRTALQLEPNNPYVRMIRAQLLYCHGQRAESIEEAKRSVDLGPTQPRTHMHLVKALYYARQFEEAVRAGDAGLDVCPDPYIAFYSSFALIALGRNEEALQRAEKVRRPGTLQAVEAAMFGFIAASAGRTQEAECTLAELRQRRESGYVPAIALAWLEMALQRYESSIQSLLLACEDDEPFLASVGVSPAYDSIRNLPQFNVFANRLEKENCL